jgi:RimJ/RimL family protein N-acetyltransferase
MKLSEVDLVIDYFHQATPEHLEVLGVDPTRLPEPSRWREGYAKEFERPIEKRRALLVIWESEERPIGFSTCDHIVFREHAKMHLHIVDPTNRQAGYGVECVKQTVRLYFDALKLERLFCEPNAFNAAPNRTLQKAGFRYVKTHQTVPGQLNYHQPVTRWVLERDMLGG